MPKSPSNASAIPRGRRLPTLLAPVVLAGALTTGSVGLAPDAGAATGPVEDLIAANTAVRDDPADYTWADKDVVPITLSGTTASSTSSKVSVTGGTVTITGAGTYRLTGTLTSGQVVVNSADAGIVRLLLNGVDVTGSTNAAIAVIAAGKVLVDLPAGTTNRLTDASTHTYPGSGVKPDAALFSTADLTISGTGSLTVNGRYGDGIACNDGIVVDSGTLTVTSVDDGIQGKDYVAVKNGTITITSGGDGLKASHKSDPKLGYLLLSGGTVSVTSAGDGLTAVTDAIVNGSAVTVRSGGGSSATLPSGVSAKGVKGTVNAAFGAGKIAVDAADDAVHSNGTVSVAGGTLTLSSGDDAIHGDAAVTVSGGATTINKSVEGVEATKIRVSGGTTTLTSTDDGVNGSDGVNGETPPDTPSSAVEVVLGGGTLVVNSGGNGVDSNGSLQMTGGTVVVASGAAAKSSTALNAKGTFTVSGGTLMAAGSSGVVATPATTSTQASVAYTFSAAQAAAAIVHLTTSSGTEIAAFKSPKGFQNLVFSSNQLTAGTAYTVYTGGSVSGTATGWYYPAGSISGATRVGTVTAK